MQDLPVTLKRHDYQSLVKTLNFLMKSKFCSFEQPQKMCTWPLITSVQCIYLKCHIAIIFLYYTNFDKHHYKDSHRTQCAEPTHLALFSSNSSTFSVIIENAVGYNFYANNSLDRPMDARLFLEVQNVTFF